MTLHWRPLEPLALVVPGHELEHEIAASALREYYAFSGPWTFTRDRDVATLRAMSAVPGPASMVFQALADAAMEHGRIEVSE